MKRNNSDVNIVKESGSATFKYNNIDDKKIYESLDKVIDKSQFIKNALYYYIVMIESGKAIDRNLPQENSNKKEDNLSTFIELLAKQQVVNNNGNENHNGDEKNQNINNAIDEENSNNDEDNINDLEDGENKIEIPSELLKAEEDDFNF